MPKLDEFVETACCVAILFAMLGALIWLFWHLKVTNP